ncbi:MAG: hypothetical protein ACLQPN_13675 [Bryobacteraceae bacterium]
MRPLSAIVAAFLIGCCTQAATPKRDWKTGTLMETAHAREPDAPVAPSASATVINVPPGGNPYAAAAAAHRPPNIQRIPTTWQGFRIEGNGYRFLVMCPVRPKHSPNVTVNGPVKYAMEKGKFYLLDEDGKEWEMTVLEKALVLPPPPVPEKKE